MLKGATKKKAAPGARYGSCIERRKNGIGLFDVDTQVLPEFGYMFPAVTIPH
jgi:hypothetical protein